MQHRLKLLVATALLSLGAASVASAQVIDFTTDAAGSKANGFVSNGNPNVVFSAAPGGNLQVGNFTPQSSGNGLGVFGDDRNYLLMDFLQPMQGISLMFGNDDPCCIASGANAMLRIFFGGTLINTVYVPVNRNDVLDQTISYSGANFDRAEFQYDANLIEVVDNILLTPADMTVTPEPATMTLLATGLAGVFGAARRRRRQARTAA